MIMLTHLLTIENEKSFRIIIVNHEILLNLGC